MDISKYNEALRQCIQDCMNCLTRMTHTASNNDCPNCCIECVQICEITSKAFTQNSEFIRKYMKLCAEVCDWCASQCEAHPYAHAQTCASSCRECAHMMRAGTGNRARPANPEGKQVPYDENTPETTSWLG